LPRIRYDDAVFNFPDAFVSGKAPPAAWRTAHNLGLRDATAGTAGPERSDQQSQRGI